MNVLLINVDSKWNIGIRRCYQYFLNRGDNVEMRDLKLSAYPSKQASKQMIIDGGAFDLVMISNIFEINKDRVEIINCDNVQRGGIGSNDPYRQLPPEIEETEPYYYPDETESYGFITRGCIRNCWFCKVPKFEGKLREYNSVERIVKHKIVHFLDNNILAYEKHCEVFQWLIDHNIRCEFNQGLDFRLINDKNLELLSKLNYIGSYIFAFDDWKYLNLLSKNIELIKKYIPKPWRLKFYVYQSPEMPISEMINRVEFLRKHYCLPYLMRDQKCYYDENKNFYTDYAAYCNQPNMFKKLTFIEFLEKRHSNRERIEKSKQIYKENGGE